MAITSINTLKQWFQTAMKPTQEQFWAIFDSFRHKSDKVPASDIEGMDDLLLSKADKQEFTVHLADEAAHNDLFGSKVDKVTGKVLSDQNFTAEEKNKLAGIYQWIAANVQGAPNLGALNPSMVPAGTGAAYWFTMVAGSYPNAGGVVVQANNLAVIIRDNLGSFTISQMALSVDLSTYATKTYVDTNAGKIKPFVNQAYTTFETQVSHLGKFWYNNAATAIGEIPGTSNKWVELLSGYVSSNSLGFIAGKNKYNYLDNTLGGHTYTTKSINASGVIGINSGWVGAEIPISPSTVYSFRHNNSVYAKGVIGMLAYLDASKAIISTIDMAALPNAGGLGGKTSTTPVNTAYIFKNVVVGANNYLNDFQIEIGTSTTSIEAFANNVEKINGLNVYDSKARGDIALNANDLSVLNKNIFTPLSDNLNFNLKSFAVSDFYIATIANIRPVVDVYLKNIGVINEVYFPIGGSLPTSTSRVLFYKNKYSNSISGKYYQTTYFLQSTSGTIANFTTTGMFVSTGTGFISVTHTSQSVTLVAGRTDLWKIVSVGQVPATAGIVELWIGSSFTGTVNGSTPDMTVGGFYCKVADTAFASGTDGYLVDKTAIPQLDLIKSDVIVLKDAANIIPKNVVFMGDSIVANTGNFTNNLLQKVSFKSFLNLAKSGASWSHSAGTVYAITDAGMAVAANNVIWNQINKLISMVGLGTASIPDVIVILCGTNDYSRTHGSASSAFAANYPITGNATNTILDVATAIRYDCEFILENYPNTQIILTTPIQRGIEDNSVIFSIGQVIKDCAYILSSNVIDLGKESGIYGKKETNNDVFLYDNLHPNTAGNEKIGAIMARRLRSIIHI